VSFVLDRLGWIEQRARQEGMPTGGFDRGRIAVGGHSFGAHTSMLLRGLQLEARWGRSVPTFQDDRLQAAVFISPQGPSASITPASYGHLEGPLLMITGAHDGTPMKGKEDKGGDWRAQAFEHTPAGDAYLLWIEGAHHGFGGISGSRWAGAGPEAPDHVLIVKSITTAFYDAYLRGNQEAHNYLNGTKLSEETDGEAYITAK
jgi:dienelactone hydrolase